MDKSFVNLSFETYTVEPPLANDYLSKRAASLQRSLYSVPKVAVVESFDCIRAVRYSKCVSHINSHL